MFKWDDKYSVGIPMIDEGHKKFIDIINKATYVKKHVNSPRAISELLVDLTAYEQEHFKTEGTCMKNYEYYDYKSHKEEHDNLSKTISNYCKKLMDGEFIVMDEVLENLEQYLVNHIQVTINMCRLCSNEIVYV
jgi:hemerythrin